MTNKTLSGTESKKKLLEGVTILNDAVSSTLGPSGRNVLIEQEDGSIRISKDGVSVANSIKRLEDPIQNMGATLLKQVANKAADKAGDGTTTSTLLATVIVQEGLRSITQGSNPVEVSRGILKASKAVVERLKTLSKEITGEEQIKQVATLSANNDPEIGNVIAQALNKAGRDGLVVIEESRTGETYLEIVEGMAIDRGFKSPFFVTDNNTMQAVLEKPKILLYDGIIMAAKDILPFLQYTSADNTPLLIVAEDIDGEALATLLINKARGAIKVAAIKAPEAGQRRTLILEDIAILTGGRVLSKTMGDILEKFPPSKMDEALGSARMVTVSRDQTTIIDGKGDQKKLTTRLQELKGQIDNATVPYEIEKLQDRLAKLIGGVAIVHVGAISEIELKERKDRVDDALHATKAAIEEGIVPGGGMALIHCLDELEVTVDNNDQQLGVDIVKKSLKGPFKKILENAGIEDHHKILHNVRSGVGVDPMKPFDPEWFGYNVKTDRYEDFLKSGVVDPTKITRTAIENAASVAATILTTESVIYQDHSDEKDKAGDGVPDMSQYM